MKMILDVHSKKPYPANVLSNFYPHHFCLDGVEINSMEGFLQSLKCTDDPQAQRAICLMVGKEAKEAGSAFCWQADGMLCWQGQTFSRYGREYQALLRRAYGQLCEVPAFARALKCSGHRILWHSIGRWRRKDTCLTVWEFVGLLYWCRRRVRQ